MVDRVPPEPPHASLHWHICQRLSYIPSVPQQNMLIIAELWVGGELWAEF